MILELHIQIWEDQIIKSTFPVQKSILITDACNLTLKTILN